MRFERDGSVANDRAAKLAAIPAGESPANRDAMGGDACHMAYNVFHEALVWFEVFLRERNIFPEEPFVPMGDP